MSTKPNRVTYQHVWDSDGGPCIHCHCTQLDSGHHRRTDECSVRLRRQLDAMQAACSADTLHRDLAWRVAANAGSRLSQTKRWIAVKRATGLGATKARDLCVLAGFGPDDLVGDPEGGEDEEYGAILSESCEIAAIISPGFNAGEDYDLVEDARTIARRAAEGTPAQDTP